MSSPGPGGTGTFQSKVRKGVVPLILKIAELFLMFVIGVYIAKVCIIAMGINGGEGGAMAYLTLFIEVAMIVITLDSLLSVTSSKPKAWKKVVRAAMLLVVFNLYYWLGISHSLSSYVVFNPLIITPVALVIMAIMFTRPVRDYYVPPLEERKPLRDWVKFAFFSPLYTSESYRIRYDG